MAWVDFFVFAHFFFLYFFKLVRKSLLGSTRSSSGAPTQNFDDLPPEQVEYYKNLSLGELSHLVEDSSANIVKGKKAVNKYKFLNRNFVGLQN